MTACTFSWTVQLSNGQLVSCSKDKTIRFWDLTTGTTVKVLRGHSDYVRTLLLLSDGCIVSGSDDCTMRVWRYGSTENFPHNNAYYYTLILHIISEAKMISALKKQRHLLPTKYMSLLKM